MVRPVALLAVLFAYSPAAAVEPTLKPDPPAKAVEWPAAIPAFNLPAGTYPVFLFSDHAGPYAMAATYAAKETTQAVFDLRTGKKVGGWKSENPPSSPSAWHALSRDGKLYVAMFAATTPMAGGAPQPPRRTLAAFDTATGNRLWEVELSSNAYRLHFVGLDQVVVERGGGPAVGPALYDAKTGKLVRELTVGALASGIRAASPGGAYLAGVDREMAVIVIDARDGTVVKRFERPQPEPDQSWYVQELEFSPDGARLAAVLSASSRTTRTYRILSWNLATGKQDADVRLPAPPSNIIPELRWSADGKAWFVTGVGVVDPDTGTVLWRRSYDLREPAQHLPLSAGRLLTVNRLGAVREVVLPKERIAAVLEAVRSGGLAVDGWLPALVKANRSGAEAVTVPPRADDWTYQPDPAPAPARKPLRLPVGRVASVHVAGPAAVCELADTTADSIAPRQLVRVDLATGKPTGRVELPHVARLADVAPEAEAAVTIDGEDTRRVDVWDLETGKHVAGWRPAGVHEPGGELLYAALLSADRVLTLTRGGELAVWSVPGAKEVYAARVTGLGVPVRSPGRKYLFALQGDTVRVIEAATGKLAGDLPTDAAPPATVSPPPGPWSHPPLAVRADGEELAAVLPPSAGTTPQLRRWDLNTAKLSDRSAFATPGVASAGTVRYAGPDHLLLADAELFGLTTRAVVWRYARPAGLRPAAAADGRYWYAVGAFAPPVAAVAGAATVGAVPGAVLVAAELPHPTAIAALKAAADNTADNLLGPGKVVGVKIDLTDPPDDKLKRSIRAALADALSSRGLEATDGKADVVLTVSARPSASGPQVTVRKLLPGQTGAGTAEKVAMPYLATRVSLTADGKPVWTGGEVQLPPPINPQPFRLPAADTDLTAWLRERAWHRLPEAWGKLALPRTLIRTPGGPVTLPGTSEFGPDGPRPIPGKN